ncbi:hypothetical protein N7528_006655 [Penicillium herquei]|nr:hypothetical protein N7528_006655 [Penicillium herquei]
MSQPKRVILRLSESDLHERGSNEIVRLYLSKTNQSLQGLEENHHFIHIQPSNSHIPSADPKIHIVIDLEKDQYSGTIGADFPHEFYRVPSRRYNGELYAKVHESAPYSPTMLTSALEFLRDIRKHHDTPDGYPWGSNMPVCAN